MYGETYTGLSLKEPSMIEDNTKMILMQAGVGRGYPNTRFRKT